AERVVLRSDQRDQDEEAERVQAEDHGHHRTQAPPLLGSERGPHAPQPRRSQVRYSCSPATASACSPGLCPRWTCRTSPISSKACRLRYTDAISEQATRPPMPCAICSADMGPSATSSASSTRRR